MEVTADSYLKSAKIIPDVSAGAVEIEFCVELRSECTLETKVFFKGRLINSSSIQMLRQRMKIIVDLHNMNEAQWGLHLWTPQTPYLYDVEFRLLHEGKPLDIVRSYFGMREIRIDGTNVLLNGEPLYQRLVLDQGYWKDSHLTPPSEKSMVEDIEKILQLGYNGVRKHQKIEDERFFFWCDVKGLLVWCEMASTYAFSDNAVEDFLQQWAQVVCQHYNHPCIITWTPVNESWGVPQVKTDIAQQNFTQAIYHLTKSIDPLRPVIVNDGWEHTVSDILTLHDYEEDGQFFSNGTKNILMRFYMVFRVIIYPDLLLRMAFFIADSLS